MRVLCIGDSLSLPRNGCNYEDTWICKLKKEFPLIDFITFFRGGMLIHDALNGYHSYFQYCRPDIIIIQEGVCDCSPRYLNDNRDRWKIIINIIAKFKLTRLFWWVVKRKPRNPACVYTLPNAFRLSYSQLVEDALANMPSDSNSGVVLIEIGHGAPSVVKKSKFFNSNVDKYNSILHEIQKKYGPKVSIISPLKDVTDDMFVDGYHCNERGMNSVFHALKNELSRIIS